MQYFSGRINEGRRIAGIILRSYNRYQYMWILWHSFRNTFPSAERSWQLYKENREHMQALTSPHFCFSEFAKIARSFYCRDKKDCKYSGATIVANGMHDSEDDTCRCMHDSMQMSKTLFVHDRERLGAGDRSCGKSPIYKAKNHPDWYVESAPVMS